MSDFTNAQSWDPSVVSARRIDHGALAVDSQFELTVRFAGRNKEMRYRITVDRGAAQRHVHVVDDCALVVGHVDL